MNGDRRPVQYAVIRVVPDPVRDEPVNVGVIVHDPAAGDVGVRVLHDLGKIRTYTGEDVDTSTVELALEAIESISEESHRQLDFLAGVSRQYTRLVQLSPVAGSLAASVSAELDALYDRFVSLERRGRRGPHAAMTRRRLFFKVKDALDERAVSVEARRRFEGVLGFFVFDFVVERSTYRSLQCLSLAGELDQATDDAKALAYSVRDIRSRGAQHSDRMIAGLELTTMLAPAQEENEATRSVRAILADVGDVRDPVREFEQTLDTFVAS